MLTLGLDLDDDSLNGTPKRVAKMYVNEIFSGLHPDKKPKSSTFKNKYKYGEMLVEKNITVYSTCEHHMLPIVGKGAYCLHLQRHGGWTFQNEQDCGLFRQKAPGTGKNEHSDSAGAAKGTRNGRCGLRHRCQTSVCKFQGDPRCRQQHRNGRIRRAF